MEHAQSLLSMQGMMLSLPGAFMGSIQRESSDNQMARCSLQITLFGTLVPNSSFFVYCEPKSTTKSSWSATVQFKNNYVFSWIV